MAHSTFSITCSIGGAELKRNGDVKGSLASPKVTFYLKFLFVENRVLLRALHQEFRWGPSGHCGWHKLSCEHGVAWGRGAAARGWP